MIDGIRLKVCGLTSLVDADFADRAGADYLGFILYSKSPRYLPVASYTAMAKLLPEGRKRVAVMVAPSLDELVAAQEAGFDFFQIHFPVETPLEQVAAWSRQVTPKRLWLAPKLPPEVDVAPELLPLAGTFLMDTFHAAGFGGSGQTGDWAKFARHHSTHPEKTWILAGGLNPENIGPALVASGARVVDVNSGVEVSPGIKDHGKIRALAVAIQRTRTEQSPHV
jgi:phosphoribosylanthranilate isomerase